MTLVLEILGDVDTATLVTGVLSIFLAMLAMDGPRWERKYAANAKEHQSRVELTAQYYQNRPNLYDLVPFLALRKPVRRRRDRYRMRAERAANLPGPLYGAAIRGAREWIETVGAFAEEASAGRVALRPFLGTYHLGVIREGVIAVPIAMSMMARDELTPAEVDRLSWGLALVELAVAYNSRARQQRGAVYFAAKRHEPPIGPVLREPHLLRRALYDVIELTESPMRIPRWGRWRWSHWLNKIDMPAVDRPYAPHMTRPTRMTDVVPLMPAHGGGVDAAEIESAIRAWVTHPAFTQLVADFGGPSETQDLPAYLDELEAFSAVWDFRAGRERNLADSAKELDGQRDGIFAAAHALGMRDAFERPLPGRYDHCLILGGMVRACVVRPLWAAEIHRTGTAFGDVTALGGFRTLGGDEPELAVAAGMGNVTDELHAMDAGLRRAFGVADEPTVEGDYSTGNPNSGWCVRRYRVDGMPLSVIAAPSSQPETRRANTADTYAWWAENIAQLGPDHRVLLVTSAIYVPFQHADAVRMLASVYGCAVETVGVPPTWTGGLSPQEFGATNYLQEMRSTIRALRMLLRHIRKE